MQLRTDDLSWREVDEDVVVLDERTWKYVHLNPTASLLWRSLAADGGASEAELSARLVENFPGAAPTADADVAAFLADLRAREYLVA
ncbi:MAG: PqqD family protein [Solirubrobacteraceae bacterium]|nr:PqqD family protein [Solirubrobacteraceae bacterium]